MHARMKNVAAIFPEIVQPLQAVGKAAHKGGVPSRTIELVELRASQINVWNRLNVATHQVAGAVWATS